MVLKTLSVFAALMFGGLINMAIIVYGPQLIPPPAGVDLSSAEGLKAGLHLFEPQHFIMPFLAHALGTFFGALLAARFPSHISLQRALLVSLVFFAGGAMNVYMLPAPLWFNITDLVFAYFPMGYTAFLLIRKYSRIS